MNDTRKCTHVGFWIVILLLAAFLVLSVLLNVGLGAGLWHRKAARGVGGGGAGEDEYPSFVERVSYGEGDTKVVRIPVEGVISRASEGGLFSTGLNMTDLVIRQVRAAQNDEDVQAIVVEVDSPGGAITPTDEIHRELCRFRDSRDDRRVVVFVRDLAASGGYYVAAAGDWIVAEPTALVGSISVLMQSLNWHGLTDRIGIEDTTIKSGRNKDILNPFREVNPEHVAMLQGVVDRMHEHFVAVVKDGRGLEDEEAKELTDGSVFTAAQAEENGLVDQVGYWEDVIDYLREELGEAKLKVVRYERAARFADLFAQIRSPPALQNLLRPSPPRLQYLWAP